MRVKTTIIISLILLATASLLLGSVKIASAWVLIDSYSETNHDQVDFLIHLHPSDEIYYSGVSQSIKLTGSYNITSVHFYLRKTGSPVGNLIARLYEHSGTFGVDSSPSSTVLAESEPVAMASLSTSFTLTAFTFNSSQQYQMIANTPYCIVCLNRDATTLTTVNRPDIGLDSSAGTHVGNEAEYRNSTWYTYSDEDVVFYLYGSSEVEYHYVVRGPYLEDTGLPYNGIVNVTFAYQNQEPYFFVLNGSSGTAETVSIDSPEKATLMTWNITSDYLHSRVYTFRSGVSFDEVWLYVPNLENVVAQYTITVIDFAGLTNATVEVDKNILGYNRIVERQNFDVSNGLAFWLTMYSQYSLKVVSDQGTFTWSLTADGIQSKTFIVSADMIPYEYSGENATVTATRNATLISVYYSESRTTWVNTTVYLVSSTGYTYVTHQLDSGTTQNYTVAISATSDYLVKIIAFQNGEVLSWQFALPKPATTTNIWTGIFEMFGIWPFNPANAVGMFIVLLFFCVGSWSDTEFFLGAGIVLAAVLTFLGWMNIPWLGISTALMVVFLMYIHKGKQEIREL